MQPAKSLKLAILALLLVALTIFPGCGGTAPPVNHSPTIIILTADSSSININQSNTITCIATDQDGDNLTYIWTKNGGTISGSGSAITWIAPATASTYAITCTVSDGKLIDMQVISITVTEPETENHSPVITSTAITSVTLPAAYTYDVDATDSNGDTLTYSLNGAPTGMTIEVHTGVINWAPTTAGSFGVTVRVSDGELTDTQTFIITVLAEESDEDKIKTVIRKFLQALSDQHWNEARTCCVYGSTLYDGIDDEEGLYDDEDIVDINYNENILEIIINDEYAEVNLNMNAELILSNGGVYQDSVECWLYLQKIDSSWKLYDSFFDDYFFDDPGLINQSPVITSTAVTSTTVGETYIYDVDATDPDEGDILTYSLLAAPTGMSINTSTGLINWIPTTAGSFGVTVRVSDGELTDTQTFIITVLAAPGDETTIEEEYNTITQVGGSAAEEFLNFEDIYGEEQALQKTVDYLNQQEGIENVSLDEESGNISFEFENGHLGIIITHDVSQSSKIEEGKKEPSFPIERIKHLPKGTPTKEKALLLNPFPSIFVGNSAQYIKGKLEAIGYQCDYYEGEEVTVELMKNMEDYGVIYIDTHGGVVNTHYGKEVDFVIGQKGSKQLYQQYNSDLMLHRLGHVWIPSLSLSHYFCILPHFIGKYAETSYPNSLIYIDACNSYKNPTMAEAFIDEGAYVYCGYSSLILAFNYSERKVFDNMIDDDMTIQEAVDEVGASNLHFHPEDREDFCLVEEDEIKFWDGSFANREWIKTTGYNGPQANYFSGSLDNIWVDDQNPRRLHLKITYDNANNRWNCAQIQSVETLGGYGKYTFYIDDVIMEKDDGKKSSVGELDKNVVIGLYTYDNGCSHPSKNEIDIEFSEWGNYGFEEGWFIVWEDAGQLERDRCNFPIQLVGKSSVHSFDWTENSIDFESVSGGNPITAHYPSIIDFNDFGDLEGDGYIPQPQNEKVLMNIWLDGGQPYSSDMKSAEIIISNFEFDRDEQTHTITASAGSHGSISPSGDVTVNQGSDKTFTITPDTGYNIDDVLVDGSSVGAVSSYTFINVTQDHTIYATFIIEEYDLRDTGPAGGYIFYDKGNYSDGWRYLEAAPVSTEWTDMEFSSSLGLIGATGTGIGTGQSNTTKIVTWLNNNGETGKAAQLCNSLVYGGYSDWFLPSIDELHLMYTNLKVYGVGGFKIGTYDYYWSSSEKDADDSWAFRFNDNYQGIGWKYATCYVRAVRAF